VYERVFAGNKGSISAGRMNVGSVSSYDADVEFVLCPSQVINLTGRAVGGVNVWCKACLV